MLLQIAIETKQGNAPNRNPGTRETGISRRQAS